MDNAHLLYLQHFGIYIISLYLTHQNIAVRYGLQHNHILKDYRIAGTQNLEDMIDEAAATDTGRKGMEPMEGWKKEWEECKWDLKKII